ncbi:type II CAAX prenyl endopeptidase Rce1 family protein [Streptomyces sp. XY511]|uniref:CPBP family glutamic-type intramembrane protease n=1 Tax=Streptomyces sp. XY511 TaxID=1519480 RepID=UPI0007C689CF|nr:CPBP family glutamic-type intramembrane protease [Streptomyces sp. XY511]
MSDTPPPNVWAAPTGSAPQWPAPAHGWPPTAPGGPPFGAPTAQQPPTRTAPAASAYHEQARNGRQKTPQRVGEFLLVIVGNLVAPLLVIAFGALVWYVLGLDFASGDGERILGDPLADEALSLLSIAAGIPVVLLAVRWCGSRPVGTVASVLGRVRWGWLARCSAVAFPLIVLQMGGLALWGYLADGEESLAGEFPGWSRFALGLVVLWALIPFQAAAEEFVFRGWLAQFFGGFLTSPWPGIAIASALFALAHGLGEWSGFALLFYSAMWWGWLTVRTGGLEAVIAVHVANNVTAYGITVALGQLAESGNAADAPWQALVLELVAAPAYCLLIARLATTHGVRRLSPGEPAERAEPTGRPEPAERAEPTGRPEPTGHPGPTGRAEPTDRAEPAV